MKHKYAIGQVVCTDNDTFRGNVEIVRHLDERCEAHNLPRYGCRHGDAAFAFCEEMIAPLTTTQRRKLN